MVTTCPAFAEVERQPAWLAYLLLIMALALLPLLGGCSAYKVAYNNLDTLLLDKADDYVDLSRDQRALLKPLLSRAHDLHRARELPRYHKLLVGMRAGVAEQKLEAEQLRAAFERIDQFWAQLRGDAEPLLVALINNTDANQQARMLARLQRDLDRKARNYQRRTAQQRIDRRTSRYRKRMEYWVGRLDSAQQQALAQFSATLPDSEAAWIDYRRRWLKQFRLAIKQQDREALSELVRQPQQLRSVALQQMIDHSRERWIDFLSVELNRLGPEQRSHLLDELDTLLNAVGELQSDNYI